MQIYQGNELAVYAVPYAGGGRSVNSASAQASPPLSGTLAPAKVLVAGGGYLLYAIGNPLKRDFFLENSDIMMQCITLIRMRWNESEFFRI